MKKTLAFIVLVALIVNCVSIPRYYVDYTRSEQIVISERVGDTINPDERERFGLFPGIEDFKAATFYGIKGGGYEIEIATESQKMHAVNMDPNAVEIMRDYIGRYAEIKGDRAAFENKWGILDYDTLGVPITENEVKLAIKQSHGRAIGGCIASCGGFSFLGLVVAIGIYDREARGLLGGAVGMGVLATGVVIGLVTGSVMIFTAYRKNTATVLKAIKEARKPRVIE